MMMEKLWFSDYVQWKKTFSKDEECDMEIQCRYVEMYTNKNSRDIRALGEQVVFFLFFLPIFP